MYRNWALLLSVAAVLTALLTLSDARGATLAGFEIDAEMASPGNALYGQGGIDWAGGGASAFTHTGAGGCYGSSVSPNPASGGSSIFLCDGSSDARFDGNGGDAVVEPEQNIVTPGGKQIQDVWNVKAGSPPAKDDFSHAYSFFWYGDSSCDADTLADDPFMSLGGHRGDNEGDAFWGFELSDVSPTGFPSLANNGGTTFNLDFNRTPGDLLVSFTLVGGGTNPLLEVFRWNSSTFALAPASCASNPSASQGDSLLRTNPTLDIQAPPWNVPVCDPTSTNATNQCRVVNGAAGDNRIAPRDFTEAVIDFSAFGVSDVCFSSLIFTSRSAHPLETADLKDVGGVAVDTCPQAAPPPGSPPGSPPGAPPAAPPGAPPGPPIQLPPTGGPVDSSADLAWMLAAVPLALAATALVRNRR